MNWIRQLSLVLLLVLIAGCSSSPVLQEGGIGGTGHEEQCKDKKEDCHDR